MHELTELLEDMVRSYHDPQDKEKLTQQCGSVLLAVKENVETMIASMPDQIAFGIFPHIFLSDKGEMFLRQYNVLEDPLPNWQAIRDQKLFKVNGEGTFIRSLTDIDENMAVKIIFSVVVVAERIQNRDAE